MAILYKGQISFNLPNQSVKVLKNIFAKTV